MIQLHKDLSTHANYLAYSMVNMYSTYVPDTTVIYTNQTKLKWGCSWHCNKSEHNILA